MHHHMRRPASPSTEPAGQPPFVLLEPSRLMLMGSPSNAGYHPSTPLLALSPATVISQPHHLYAPGGTPLGNSYASPSEWQQQFLQIAAGTTGFLSPAANGAAPSPTAPPHASEWPPHRSSPSVGPSPLTLPIPVTPPASQKHVDMKMEDTRTSTQGGDAQDGKEPPSLTPGFVSGGTKDESPSHLPESFGASAAWLHASVPYFSTSHAPAADGGASEAAGGRLVDTVFQSKSLTEQLLRELSVEGAVEVLRTALSLLGRPLQTNGEGQTAPSIDVPTSLVTSTVNVAGADSNSAALPSVKLVHPDEFKNPSTFLKIYGDPLCFTKIGPLPKKGRNGNWECIKCNNVNFPRRFRCNMCSTTRHEEGDRVVSDYARQVYERYLYIYKNQQQLNSAAGSADSAAAPPPDQPPTRHKQHPPANKRNNRYNVSAAVSSSNQQSSSALRRSHPRFANHSTYYRQPPPPDPQQFGLY